MLGTPHLKLVKGMAPQAYGGLADPDAIFIGGGLGDPGVIEGAWARLKTGGRLVRHARYFALQLAETYLTGALFRQILARIERLAWHPT